MQSNDPVVADLLCLEENAMNQGRESLNSVTPGDGGEIYEPLWDRQSTDANQNGILSVPSPRTQNPSDVPPPLPRRTASTRGESSNPLVRPRARHSVTNQTTLSGIQLPSYAESESNNLASPAYPAGRGSVNNNVGRSLIPDSPPPAARAQGVGNVSSRQNSVSNNVFQADYPFMGGATASPSPTSPIGASPFRNAIGAGAVPLSPAGALPAKMMEAMGLSDAPDDDPVFGWNAPPVDDQGAPPPYMPRSASQRGPQVSLKERQVEALKKEMEHAGGVKVVLRKVDCHHTVAWVECFNGVWIAGWNQKARPFLHNAFHVGDQIISINGQVIEGAKMAHKLIKHSDDSAKITFILRRVPNARVYLLKRTEDGESLGIRREGGTGEILELDPFSVAANHGMPIRAPTHDRQGLCNWFITEVNMRPVSLYFKGDEIEKRLNAVGKEISVLIQPGDFIAEIKQLMKKNFKNYKDYVVL